MEIITELKRRVELHVNFLVLLDAAPRCCVAIYLTPLPRALLINMVSQWSSSLIGN